MLQKLTTLFLMVVLLVITLTGARLMRSPTSMSLPTPQMSMSPMSLATLPSSFVKSAAMPRASHGVSPSPSPSAKVTTKVATPTPLPTSKLVANQPTPTLTPNSATLIGKITVTGRLHAPDAVLNEVLISFEGQDQFATLTSSDGSFTIFQVNPGSYTILALTPDLIYKTGKPVVVQANSTQVDLGDINLVLQQIE